MIVMIILIVMIMMIIFPGITINCQLVANPEVGNSEYMHQSGLPTLLTIVYFVFLLFFSHYHSISIIYLSSSVLRSDFDEDIILESVFNADSYSNIVFVAL